MRIVNDFKTAKIAGSIRWHLQDDLAGLTTHGRRFRKDYKASVRHARRVLAHSLRTGRLEA